jgi:hypothetical protein
MDFEKVREGMRRANFVAAGTTPFLAVAYFLLRDAGEKTLEALGLAYFFGSLAIFMIVQARAERREERRDQ